MELDVLQTINFIIFTIIFFINHKQQAWKRIPFLVLVASVVFAVHYALTKEITSQGVIFSLHLAVLFDFISVLVEQKARNHQS